LVKHRPQLLKLHAQCIWHVSTQIAKLRAGHGRTSLAL
jgi:hypothetical protein